MRFKQSLAAFSASCALAGCGSSGGGPGEAPQPSTAGHFNLNSTSVSGSFAVGTSRTPAAGYDLWLFGHSQASLEEVPLDDAGSFRVPLSHFTEGSLYSLHLMQDYEWIGDLDLAVGTPGTQPAFTYQGGLGFDLGQVLIPVDSRGLPKSPADGIPAYIGGGFSIAPKVKATFADYPLPSQAASVAFSSQLFVFDASTLLYSFYGRTAHPAAYASDLKRYYRLGALVLARDETRLTAVEMSRAGRWQTSARLAASDDGLPEAQPLLGALPAPLVKTVAGRYEFSLYSGGMPTLHTTAVFRLRPSAGAELPVPRRVARLLSMPPQVVAAATAGGVPSALDYNSTTAVNGLTRPLCQSGEVVLDLAPPLNEQGAAIPASAFDRIEVGFDYYRTQDAKTTKVAVDATQFAAPYAKAVHDTALTDLTRDWDPTKQLLVFTLGPTAAAAASQELRLWPELFAAVLSGKTTDAVRLRLYYRSDAEGTAAATAIWFKRGC